ncbi:cysteine--tRNA ligase [uncultured Hoeflea sp.]|uniref:cysteine--tRNA ligase n=1 Tax=uncultured Hoeflea sp. TaxID=538666 RepID=UPI0026224BCA|nr:cysteine--tRNA ligase [uncultured Hoeflea sp.]
MSELNFWNTLTRTKEAFEPIDDTNVRMYVCGPTVYDFAHIGNARPVIVFDVLYRLLRHVYGAEHVTYVRNITDVDDKINARALRDYPDLQLNEAIAKVTEKTAERFHKDAAALGCLEPTHEPRATAHIDGMVAMIQTLIDKGNAYVTSGREGREVLFAVGSMPDYGKLSNRKLEDQQAGARIAVEDHKRNPADFVLWKESAADEPGWDAEFREDGQTTTIHGRPGWHIECSVMSRHHLGEVFDIHGGGLDLIFPHHENEIAQSCCAHGKDRMANLWMHNGFLQVEGRKMSKSEGNFVTIAELLETDKFGGRKWPGEVLRLAMLMTHYREPIDFSVKRLDEAETLLNRWYRIWPDVIAAATKAPDPSFLDAFADDLSSRQMINNLYQITVSDDVDPAEKAAIAVASAEILGLMQIDPAVWFEGDADRGAVLAAIDRRLAFIAAKNWPEADKIRNELLAQGIQLKDGKDTETGERVTTWEVKR